MNNQEIPSTSKLPEENTDLTREKMSRWLSPSEKFLASVSKNFALIEAADILPPHQPAPNLNQDEQIRQERITTLIEEMLALLPDEDRSKEIVRMRCGFVGDEAKSLEEIAQHFGLTRERVRAIEAKMIRKLRTIVEANPDIAGEIAGLLDELN